MPSPLALWLCAVALLLTAIAAVNEKRRDPLLVDSAYRTTPQDRRFVPCPLSPRQVPRTMERTA